MIKILLIALLVVFCILQVADVLTTLSILNRGGRELNPILVKLMERFGRIQALLLMKAIAIAAVALIAVAAIWHEITPSYGLAGLLLLDGIYAFVVYRNVRQMPWL